MSSNPHLWLRDEVKALEHRSALTPTTAKQLLEDGFQVTVERSKPDVRIFLDEEFEQIPGIKMVESGSWPKAPKNAYIIGLKELPEESFPLVHDHIQFAHCYKRQGGWKEVLGRFPAGGGTLLDLEFLEDNNGRRVAAFGYHAGYAGAALAVEVWAWQITNPGADFPGVSHYDNEDLLNEHVSQVMKKAEKKVDRLPRILIIGALGRCGSGAVALARNVGIPEANIIKWDMAETNKGGPFKEIVESDIFVNCIYLKDPIPPFVDVESLNSPSRKLSVICDVSCDTTNPHNPIPVYKDYSYFSKPTVSVNGLKMGPEVSVIAIDHLPSLLPREASESFSGLLLPSLKQLKDRKHEPVWTRAETLFNTWVARL